MANSRVSPGNSFSSDSDDEDEWSELHKRSKKKKNQSRKKTMADAKTSHVEEGEIFSDELDDDDDDGLDENLLGGEEDKRKLERMSEKEREEELFKRAERRDAIMARRLVKQKLKEKRDRERAEAVKHAESSVKPKKRSAYEDIFSSDTEEAKNSDSSGAGPRGLRQRKLALEKRKAAESHKFHELIERRRQKAAKKRRTSGSEEERDASHISASKPSATSSMSESDQEEKTKRSSNHGKQTASVSERVFPSDASDSSASSHSVPRRPLRQNSISSLSGSERSGSSSEDNARGRSRSPEEELVRTVQDLSRIRLSRFKLEKWVHMPFFDDLIKGCFVRIHIGLNQGVPIYRCAEIVDVVETPKIYDLGDTRTNKGVVLRVGRDQSTFRLAFVSNSEFLPSEFDSWMRRINEAGMKPPTMAFVREKTAKIQDAIIRPIKDSRVVDQIIQSKKRFQKAPTNFALRKAELMKQREVAEADGDTEALRKLDLELEDIEAQADKIDRRRTLGFKSITSINQRNRVLSVLQAEEAIRKESEEARTSKEEDPFTRVHSQPVIVTKKYLEKLRHKRSNQTDATDSETTLNSSTADGNKTWLANSTSSICLSSTPSGVKGRGDFQNTPERVSWSIADEDSNASTPQDALHAIHNFEININLDLDGSGDQALLGSTPARRHGDLDSSGRPGHHLSDSIRSRDSLGSNLSHTAAESGPTPTANRRVLNLEAYKKQRGLI
ncbi:RNA polymerase associated protein RTF1 [Fasciola hepatica]|uniref:RNA polymerase associated protein RTF1 n=1 Tax=Fasciola hepatica TaxID=6192 RepID=A0A4E0RJK1_FASHE|nr:RNA polymerase associated protein RTF1 [Fasciola hepatica]